VRTARRIGIVGLAAAAALGFSTTTASAATEPPKRTVASVQTNVKARTLHITTKMRSLQTRVAANKHFTAATKTTIQADITKVLTDTSTWRTKIASATTMAAVQAATPARQAVMRDLTKLRADLAAARRKSAPAAK
jgi:hypothetical protein